MAMTFTFATFAVVLLIDIAFFGLIIYLIVLLIKALRKYLRSPLSARRRRRQPRPWEKH